MARPTLQEVAAMPWPASVAALRKFYDPYWAKFDFEDGPREVRVSIDSEVTRDETFSIAIEATSIEDAEKQAKAELREQVGKVDIVAVRVFDPQARSAPQPSLFETLQ